MTVKELRELLIDYPDDMLIVFRAHKGGLDTLEQDNINCVNIVLDYDTNKLDPNVGAHRESSRFHLISSHSFQTTDALIIGK